MSTLTDAEHAEVVAQTQTVLLELAAVMKAANAAMQAWGRVEEVLEGHLAEGEGLEAIGLERMRAVHGAVTHRINGIVQLWESGFWDELPPMDDVMGWAKRGAR